MIASKGPVGASCRCEDAASLVADVTMNLKMSHPNIEPPYTKDEFMKHFKPEETERPAVEQFMAPLTRIQMIKYLGSFIGVRNIYELNRNMKQIADCEIFDKDKFIMIGFEYVSSQGHMVGGARSIAEGQDNRWMLLPVDGQNRDGHCKLIHFVGVTKLYLFSFTNIGREIVSHYWQQK